MRKYLLLLFPFISFGQTITLSPIGGASVVGIPVTVEQTIPGATTGTISQLTSNIPADRGQASNVIWTTANSDQGLINITYPTGYEPKIGSTTYTQSTLHANAWLTFGTSTYSGYNGSASQPNVPTLHFTSVNNGSTDNNMSHASWETYTDSYWGDVYRLRYEGSYKYSVSGINTKIDIYFIKNTPTKYIVVLRQFLADGSNQEQIGVSNGSVWLASNLITNASYTTGQAWEINTATTQAGTTILGPTNTDANGTVTFSNPNNYSYDVTIDISQQTHTLVEQDVVYMMYRKMFPLTVSSWDFYTGDVNGDGILDLDDLIAAWQSWQGSITQPSYIFTESEKINIEANSTLNYTGTYPPQQNRTVSNQSKFYIISTGKHQSTINTLTEIQ